LIREREPGAGLRTIIRIGPAGEKLYQLCLLLLLKHTGILEGLVLVLYLEVKI